jgi:hypothetical protein
MLFFLVVDLHEFELFRLLGYVINHQEIFPLSRLLDGFRLRMQGIYRVVKQRFRVNWTRFAILYFGSQLL